MMYNILADINNNWIETITADVGCFGGSDLDSRTVWGLILEKDHIKYNRTYIPKGNTSRIQKSLNLKEIIVSEKDITDKGWIINDNRASSPKANMIINYNQSIKSVPSMISTSTSKFSINDLCDKHKSFFIRKIENITFTNNKCNNCLLLDCHTHYYNDKVNYQNVCTCEFNKVICNFCPLCNHINDNLIKYTIDFKERSIIDYLINFGKYKNKTLLDVVNIDPNYLKWALDNANIAQGHLKTMCDYFLVDKLKIITNNSKPKLKLKMISN